MADLNFRPIYANNAAFRILSYSSEWHEANEEASAQERLQFILQATQYTSNTLSHARFVSGRRHYVCRSFLLDAREGDTRPQLVAVLMERHRQLQGGLREVSRQFHLSPREYETVLHLIKGLTTKEIAQSMRVSPNTVKQFVRLIMSKMSVTTRSGILGKLLAR